MTGDCEDCMAIQIQLWCAYRFPSFSMFQILRLYVQACMRLTSMWLNVASPLLTRWIVHPQLPNHLGKIGDIATSWMLSCSFKVRNPLQRSPGLNAGVVEHVWASWQLTLYSRITLASCKQSLPLSSQAEYCLSMHDVFDSPQSGLVDRPKNSLMHRGKSEAFVLHASNRWCTSWMCVYTLWVIN